MTNLKINEGAVQSLMRTTVGANNAARRELEHAFEYYNSAPSDQSIKRLLVAASTVMSQNEIWLSSNSEKARAAFCAIMEVAA